MNRMVWCVFKAIALSIIFVFVWDMGFYLYRTFALNQRMEMLMSSMTKVVQENNYLPEQDMNLYKTLFQNIAYSMNGDKSKYTNNDETTGENYRFVNGYTWNYDYSCAGTDYTNKLPDVDATVTNVNGTPESRNILVRTMDKSACYGDIMAVYVAVNVNTPFWTFDNTTSTFDSAHNTQNVSSNGTVSDGNDSRSIDHWHRNLRYSTVTLDYLYYVPCMNYTSVTD